MGQIRPQRKMVKKSIALIFIIAIVLQLSLTLADTSIKIKTLPSHRISIIIREAGKLTSLESFHQDTSSGELTIASTATVSNIDMLVTLKKDTENIINRKYEGLTTGQELFLNFIPGEEGIKTAAEIAAEEEAKKAAEAESAKKEEEARLAAEAAAAQAANPDAVTETTAVQKTTEQTGPGLTTLAITQVKENFSIIGAILIGLIVVGVLVFTFKGSFSGNKTENFKVKPLSQLREEQKIAAGPNRIEEMEGKLQSLQSELGEIKNKEARMREIKERMAKDREEYRKLQGGEFNF